MPFRALKGLWPGLCAVLALSPPPAFGQTPGTRAAGMAEAFVAVADDATSIYWNPAGMATGAFLSVVVDYGSGEAVPDRPAPAGRQSTAFVGVTVPPLGLGYYRLSRRLASPSAPEGTRPPSREDGRQSVQGLTTSHVGVTLGQSLGRYVVVAGTVKYVHGEVVSGTFDGTREAALDAAGGLPSRDTSRADVDAGLMVAVEQWRLGLAARNLTSPAFARPDAAGGEVELDPEYRLGVAWGAGWPGTSRLVVSADADLARKPAMSGDRRDLAAGVETWWRQQRFGVRGGVRGSTVGEARPIVAAGVSAAMKTGVFVEAHVARGDEGGHTWSVGARVTF